MLNKETIKVAITTLAGFGIAFLIVGTSPSFQACVQEHQKHAADSALQEYVRSFLVFYKTARGCGGEWLHDHGEAIIALFTVILGIATWLLWRSTKALVAGAEKTAERQLRAYVGVTPRSIQRLALNRSHFMFDARNAGQTPAYECINSAFVDIFPYPLPEKFNFPELTFNNDPSVFTIHASDPPNSHNCMASSSRVFEASEMQEACTEGAGQRLYVFGIVKYTDVFNEPRTTKFCYCIYPMAGFGIGAGQNTTSFGFEATSQHNEAK